MAASSASTPPEAGVALSASLSHSIIEINNPYLCHIVHAVEFLCLASGIISLAINSDTGTDTHQWLVSQICWSMIGKAPPLQSVSQY